MIHSCFNLRISLSYHCNDPELYFSGLILGFICRILLLWVYADNLWTHDCSCSLPLPFHDSHVTIGTLSSSPSCHPLLTELTCCYIVPLCCPEYCGIQPGSNDIKWGGIDAFFKLEISKRQNPLLFETIGSVVLSSCSFRETVGWVLFFPTHALTGCCSFAWSNWANEIPNL